MKPRLIIVFFLGLLACFHRSHSQTPTYHGYTYIGPDDGDWFSPSNWDVGEVPNSFSIPPTDVYQALIDSNRSALIAAPGALIGSLFLDGGALTVSGSGSLNVEVMLPGYVHGQGLLSVIDGGTVTSSMGTTIGFFGPGFVLVSGTGSTYTGFGSALVGQFSSGYLAVRDSGVATFQTDLSLGNGGSNTGTIRVDSGGVLAVNSVQERDSSGSLVLDGGTLRALQNKMDFLADFADGHFMFDVSGGTIDTQSFSVGVDASIRGPGGLTKTGFGQLTLTGSNTYEGGTVIRQGSIKVEADANLGKTGTAVILDGGGLSLISENTLTRDIQVGPGGGRLAGINDSPSGVTTSTYAGAISGTSALSTFGNANVCLTGDNSGYSGILTASFSVLIAGSNTALGSNKVVLSNSATLGLLNGVTIGTDVLAGSTAGGGASIENFGGNNTYAGTISLNGITLSVRNPNTVDGTLTISGSVNGSGSLWLLADDDRSIHITGGIDLAGSIESYGDTTITGTISSSITSLTQRPASTLRIGDGGTNGNVNCNIVNTGTVVFNRSDSATFAKRISGSGSVEQAGSGTLTFTGSNTYTGGTKVTAGTLVLDNTTLAGTMNVSAGATLAGEGMMQGNASVLGILDAGQAEAGLLAFAGNLTLGSTATVLTEITGTAGAAYDIIVVEGALTYGGTLSLDFQGAYIPEVGDHFDLFRNFSSQSGTFADIDFVDPGFEGAFDYSTGTLTLTAVPEPSTCLLAASSFVLFLSRVRRRTGALLERSGGIGENEVDPWDRRK